MEYSSRITFTFLMVLSLIGCGRTQNTPLSQLGQGQPNENMKQFNKPELNTVADEDQPQKSISGTGAASFVDYGDYSRTAQNPSTSGGGSLSNVSTSATATCSNAAIYGAPQFPLRTVSYGNLFQIQNGKLCQYQVYDPSQTLDINNPGYFQTLISANVEKMDSLLGRKSLLNTVVADFRNGRYAQVTHIYVVTSDHHVVAITWINGSWSVQDLHDTVYPVTAEAVTASEPGRFQAVQVRGVDKGKYRYHKDGYGRWLIN